MKKQRLESRFGAYGAYPDHDGIVPNFGRQRQMADAKLNRISKFLIAAAAFAILTTGIVLIVLSNIF